jgi:6-phosphogluconolactonase (cycloisomerase 2 family)
MWIAKLVAVGGLVCVTACGGGGGSGGCGGGQATLPSRFVYVTAAHETSPGQDSGGIYAYRFDPASCTLTTVAGSPFATELGGAPVVMSSDAKFLYATYSTLGKANPILVGYRIQADGSVVSVPGSPYATAEPIATLVANPAANFLYVFAWNGALQMYAIDPSTGALTAQAAQSGVVPPLGASLVITPDGKYFYGITSFQGYEYSIDAASGALTALPGSPVQLAIPSFEFINDAATVDPSGKFIYVANEIQTTGFGGSLYGLTIDPQNGSLSTGSPFSPTNGPQQSVAVDPSGKYLLVSTVITSKTGPNCLAVADINPTSGQLNQVPGSPFPGNSNENNCGVLLADASEPYIYESSGPYVQVYSLDLTTGIPTEIAAAGVGEQIVTSLAVTH